MAGRADIRDPEALRHVRAAVARFCEAGLRCADDAAGELAATLHWLRHERIPDLRRELRRREEDVAAAAAAYRTARDLRPSCVEEEIALRRARARLEDVRSTLDACRAAQRGLDTQAPLAAAWIERLRGTLGSHGRRAMARLDRMRDGVDDYLRAATPAEGSP